MAYKPTQVEPAPPGRTHTVIFRSFADLAGGGTEVVRVTVEAGTLEEGERKVAEFLARQGGE